MKKILNLAWVAALAIGMVSCADDANEIMGNDNTQNGKTLTFVLPGNSNVITYSNEVPASDEEKFIDLEKTKIFMFSDDNELLEAILDENTITSGTNADGKPTATIDIQDGWEGDKTFFLIANTAKGADGSLPDDSDINSMEKTDFMELLTVAETGKLNNTDGLLLSGYVSVAEIETNPQSEVNMYRSVARFDIDQDVTANGVQIKTIDITNANRQGYITAYGRGISTATLAKGDLQYTDSEINQDLVTETVTVDGTDEDHEFQRQESAFYLYPTHLNLDGSGTIITLIGEVSDGNNGTKEEIFTLNKEESKIAEDCEILANTRYIISALNINTHTFVLTIADWDEGEELVGRPGGPASGFSIIAPAPSDITNGTFNSTYNSIEIGDPTLAFEANLVVKGTSTSGVTAKVISQTGAGFADASVITATAAYDGSGITYAIPYYGYNLKIEFAAGSFATNENITATVRLTDVATKTFMDIIVFYATTTDEVGEGDTKQVLYPTGAGYLPAVKFGTNDDGGEIYWAPVNVGASTINGTDEFSNRGHLYQWGRNIPFSITSSIDQYQVAPVHIGPVSYEDAHTTYKDYIIDGSSNSMNWLDVADQTLWEGTNTPCPTGWRMPTFKEYKQILDRYTISLLNTETHRFEMTIDETGEVLYFPLTGIVGANGKAAGFGVFGQFWTGKHHSNPTINNCIFYFDVRPGRTPAINAAQKHSAAAVRCVKDAN